MAQDSFLDKTEEPTPKKLQKTREEGNVAKSPELNSAFILLFGLFTLYYLSDGILARLVRLFKSLYQQSGSITVNPDTVLFLAHSGLGVLSSLLMPLVLVLVVVGVGVNVMQFGFLFTLKPLQPKLSKLNPIAGLKRFASLKSLVELVKSFAKIVVIATVAFLAISGEQERFILLMHESVGGMLSFIGHTVFRVALHTTAALMVLALLDFLYQKWQFKKDLRMTKQEVKDERKDAEGDPLVRNAIRSLQRQRALQRMMDDVPEADVVVTNPTQLAVALKYDPETMNAPVVLAKGARLLAERIREIAARHGIPIIENKPLAQSLYKNGKVGVAIPFELFQAVAELFAHVYQLKNKRLT